MFSILEDIAYYEVSKNNEKFTQTRLKKDLKKSNSNSKKN